MIAAAWALAKGIFGPILEGLAKVIAAIPWQAWVIAAVLLGWWWERGHHGEERYQAGYTAAETKYQAEIAAQAEAARQALQEAKDAAREAEQRQAAELAAQAAKFIEEREQGYEERDRVIADLRAGDRRLRERFRCPAAGAARGSAGVPPAGAAAGRGDEAGEGGFTRADAEVALRIAADGDAAIRQLAACQAVVKSYVGQ